MLFYLTSNVQNANLKEKEMESRKERLDLELELLQKGQWDFRDVMKYYRIGKNKASDVIRKYKMDGQGDLEGNFREAFV